MALTKVASTLAIDPDKVMYCYYDSDNDKTIAVSIIDNTISTVEIEDDHAKDIGSLNADLVSMKDDKYYSNKTMILYARYESNYDFTYIYHGKGSATSVLKVPGDQLEELTK